MTDPVPSTRPLELRWKDQPALPPGAQVADVIGNPHQPGKYVFRLRVAAGHHAPPHAHPEDRVYTVLSGTFHLGFGEVYREDDLEAFPEGRRVDVPAGRYHFQFARSGEYLVQVEGVGPTAVVYARTDDDPRSGLPARG